MYLECALLSAQKINSVAVRFTLTRPSFQGSREWNRRRKPPMTGPLSASPSAWPPCRYFPSRIAPRPPTSIWAWPSEFRHFLNLVNVGFISFLCILFLSFFSDSPLFPDCAPSRAVSSPAETSSASPLAATAPRQPSASSRPPRSETTTEAVSDPCQTGQATRSMFLESETCDVLVKTPQSLKH